MRERRRDMALETASPAAMAPAAMRVSKPAWRLPGRSPLTDSSMVWYMPLPGTMGRMAQTM